MYNVSEFASEVVVCAVATLPAGGLEATIPSINLTLVDGSATGE